MSRPSTTENRSHQEQSFETVRACQPVCPACGGPLFEIRAKLQCAQCHTICETCCEGGRG
jgi:hypothetical protein